MKVYISFMLLCLSFTLNAEVAYNIYAVDLASAEYSEAYSLNNAGTVAGQYSVNGDSADFIWTLDTGVQTIQNHTVPGSHPHINNQGDVAGALLQNNSQGIYTYSADQKLTILGKPESWLPKNNWPKDKNLVVTHFNDLGAILCADNADPKQAKVFCLWCKGGFYLAKETDSILLYPQIITCGGINNLNQMISTVFIKLLNSFQMANKFILRDIDNNSYVEIGDGKTIYYSYGINDVQNVIARTDNEGFLWSAETGMSSLGDFLPIDLNNKGEIIGKKGDQLQLRQANGETIDLAQAIQYSTPFIEGFEKLLEVWDINDNGWIVGTALISGKRQAVLLVPQEIKG